MRRMEISIKKIAAIVPFILIGAIISARKIVSSNEFETLLEEIGITALVTVANTAAILALIIVGVLIYNFILEQMAKNFQKKQLARTTKTPENFDWSSDVAVYRNSNRSRADKLEWLSDDKENSDSDSWSGDSVKENTVK